MARSNHDPPPEEIELEDGTYSTSTSSTLKTSCRSSNLELQLPTASPPPPPSSSHQRIAFTRTEHSRGSYTPTTQSKLKNSLLAGVGFLELANCGDFAANVWNEVPVPLYAQVLMGLGGALALFMSYFAFKDALLSWRNVRRLREERAYLRVQKAEQVDGQGIRCVDALLAVNGRELGTEVVDRVCMDLLMGCGAVVVGVATLMAIDGVDPNVFYVSNLLSGYIGNAPAAVYGAVNAFWSVYVWRRARRHGTAGSRELKDEIVERHLRPRIRRVQIHAVVNGVTGVVAGAASLVTATLWWGYVMLIPCIVSSIYCNYFWRSKIGYERILVQQQQQILKVNKASLIEELESIAAVLQAFRESPAKPLRRLMDVESMASVIEFIIVNSLFEGFCLCLLADPLLSMALFGPTKADLMIDLRDLLTADEPLIPRILEVAQKYVCKVGLVQFQYRERYLLESLGCYLYNEEVGPASRKGLSCA